MADFIRLETLFGAKLDKATHASIKRLVEGHVVEDADIDFKREPHSEGESLATDVSAMANTVGGVLVLGVDETAGVATALNPVMLTDEVTDKLKQWLAELVVPYVMTDVRRVPDDVDAAKGYYLIIIPKSPNAPHAVKKKGSLRYYHRDGGRNRPLTENEVADAYRNRFQAAQAQVDRLAAVREDGMAFVGPHEFDDVWLAVTLVPNSPGQMTISAQRLRDLERWALTHGGQSMGDGVFWNSPPSYVSTGVRRAVVASRLDPKAGHPRYCYAELHQDGAAFVARDLRVRDRRIHDASAVLAAAGALRLVVDHAVANTGAHGDAMVQCELLSSKMHHNSAGLQMGLGHHDRFSEWEALPRSRTLASAPQVAPHTVNMDAIWSDRVEWLAATRLLLTDTFVAEVVQLTPEGNINAFYWDQQTLNMWQRKAGVPVVELAVDLGW